MTPIKTRDYVVGKGKPPQSTQFKKGQSGNPEGRPKGTKNLSTVIRETLDESVNFTENKKIYSITKREAVVKAIVNKAVRGNMRAADLTIRLIESTDGLKGENKAVTIVFEKGFENL
jgi:Family of unknown function (DUF5681)